jgi:hypothetical protein
MTSHLQIPKVAPTIPKLPEHPRSQKRFPVDSHNNRGRRPMNYSRACSITQVPRFYSLQREFTPPSFLRKTLDIPRHPTPKILASKAQTKEVQNEASRPPTNTTVWNASYQVSRLVRLLGRFWESLPMS